jgi:hypothetical protein
MKLAPCPQSLAATLRSFTFYVGNPISFIPEFLINLPLPEIRNFGVGRWVLSVRRLLLFLLTSDLFPS